MSAAVAAVGRWVEAYLTAWQSNDPDDIRSLFVEDGDYRTEPWTTPVHGQEAIVAEWLHRQDAPNSFGFTWSVRGVDGSTAFVEGETRYDDGRTYSNLWIIDLAGDGRARSFTEWWMDQAEPSS